MRKVQAKADFVGYRSQYDRVRRMLERIYANADDERAFTDDLLTFCMHCTHLADWIESDRYVPSQSKRIVRQAQAVAKWLPICRDLANGVKHVRVDKPKSAKRAKYAHVERTKRRDQKQVTLDVIFDDGHGRAVSGLAIALNCVDEWRSILKDAGLTTKRLG